MVAGRSTGRVVVKRRHCRKISGSDRRLARSNGEVSGQLRPEGGFERQVFPSDQHAGIGEKTARRSDVIIERLETAAFRGAVTGFLDVGQYLEREVMITHDKLIARQRVQSILELGCLRNSEIAGIRHSIVLTLQ